MNIFMQSLVDDARDFYRSFPNSSIDSWREFKQKFKEQYDDHSDPSFSLK